MIQDNIYQKQKNLIVQALIEIDPLNFKPYLTDEYEYITEKILSQYKESNQLISYFSNYTNIKYLLNSYDLKEISNETYQALSKRITYYLSYLDICILDNDKITLTKEELIYIIHNDFIITFKNNIIYINNKLYKTFNQDIYTHKEIIDDLKDELNQIINDNNLIYIEYDTPHYDLLNPFEQSYIYVVNLKHLTYEDIPYKNDITKIFNTKEVLKK